MRWVLALAILLFGIVTIDLESTKWIVLGIVLFSLPLIFQLTKIFNIHIWALWGGIFLVLQSILTPILINPDYITLPPNLNLITDIKSGVTGIHGKQKITTDAKGYRTTKEIDYQNDDTYRIFAIGGSTTEQIYLDDRATWTHLLQENLRTATNLNIEVVNTGVSGLRAKQHLATLEKIIPLHPDMAIFLMGINDWNRHIKDTFPNHTVKDASTKGESLRERLSMKNTLMGKLIVAMINAIINPANNDGEPEYIEENGEFHNEKINSLFRETVLTFNPQDVSEDYRQQLIEISETCHTHQITCVFLTQPHGYQPDASEPFRKGFWMTPPLQPYTLDFESMRKVANLYNDYLIKFGIDSSHEICDAAAHLDPTNEFFYDDCHFNTSGARHMGSIVSQCVEKILEN